jgi:hypothetical protein
VDPGINDINNTTSLLLDLQKVIESSIEVFKNIKIHVNSYTESVKCVIDNISGTYYK